MSKVCYYYKKHRLSASQRQFVSFLNEQNTSYYYMQHRVSALQRHFVLFLYISTDFPLSEDNSSHDSQPRVASHLSSQATTARVVLPLQKNILSVFVNRIVRLGFTAPPPWTYDNGDPLLAVGHPPGSHKHQAVGHRASLSPAPPWVILFPSTRRNGEH